MKKSISILLIYIFSVSISFSQSYLSHLDVTQDEPIYTTYAAALGRSEYKVNEAYQFIWYDPEKSMSFESSQAGELGVAFKLNGIIKI